MLALKPDFEQARQRIEAFWENTVEDRPVVNMSIPIPSDKQVPLPRSAHPDPAARWMDAQYQAELACANLNNQEYLAETLPIAFPNLGPEVFSAFYGCPLHFGDVGTSWTDPILHEWSQAPALRLDWNSPFFKKLVEMTDILLEMGKDRFLTGMTDWHPGGDAIAAFRDPANLAMDLVTNKTEILDLLERVTADYFQVYNFFYEKLRAAGQPITSWTPLLSEGKYYIPSNDFSIMISKAMFNEVFLPGISAECRFLDRSIYHLDGPGALRHLDSLLAIPELNAVQWVFGAGNEGYRRWIEVYRRIQAAGKGAQVMIDISELDQVMQTLSPRGLFLQISGVPDRETGLTILKALERWTSEQRKAGCC